MCGSRTYLGVTMLVPAALMMTLLSMGLYLAGLVTSYWLHVHPENRSPTKQYDSSLHYGVFIICYPAHNSRKAADEQCESWTQYGNEPRRSREYRSEYESTIDVSLMILCMNLLALAETSVFLAVYIFKAPTRFWIQAAWSCSLASLIYSVTGSSTFLAIRVIVEKAQMSLGWSAITVLVSVAVEVVAVLCLKVFMLWQTWLRSESNMDEESITVLSTPRGVDQDPQFADSANLPDRRTSKATPELLRLIQKEKEVGERLNVGGKPWLGFQSSAGVRFTANPHLSSATSTAQLDPVQDANRKVSNVPYPTCSSERSSLKRVQMSDSSEFSKAMELFSSHKVGRLTPQGRLSPMEEADLKEYGQTTGEKDRASGETHTGQNKGAGQIPVTITGPSETSLRNKTSGCDNLSGSKTSGQNETSC